MILLLDIGNSRVKPATWAGQGLVSQPPIAHAGEPAAAIAQLPAIAPESIWVANVTGHAHEAKVADALRRRFGLAAEFARTADERDGLRNAYNQPERLGVDRWLMLLALWHELRGPFCVAAAGTALTFDAVDASGLHRGGFIAAGLSTQLSATLGATRFATHSMDAPYTSGLGTDTEACVRQGALHATVGALDRAARRVDGPRFLCGGDAGVLQPHLEGSWSVRPNLVLEGLLVRALDE